jgi:chromosome segregation ATPase
VAQLRQQRDQELEGLRQQLQQEGSRERLHHAQELAQMQQQVKRLEVQVQDARAEAQELQLQLRQAQQRVAASGQQHQQHQQRSPELQQAAGGGAGMLELMEGQLQRLSELLRSREEQVGALQAALLAGAEERRGLQQELAAARQQLPGQAAGATEAAVPRAEASCRQARSKQQQQQQQQQPASGGVVWGAPSSHGRSSRAGKA